MLSERSQTQKPIYCTIPQTSGTGKCAETESRVVVAGGLGEEDGE